MHLKTLATIALVLFTRLVSSFVLAGAAIAAAIERPKLPKLPDFGCAQAHVTYLHVGFAASVDAVAAKASCQALAHHVRNDTLRYPDEASSRPSQTVENTCSTDTDIAVEAGGVTTCRCVLLSWRFRRQWEPEKPPMVTFSNVFSPPYQWGYESHVVMPGGQERINCRV